MKLFWKRYHKWVGIVFSFFILMFCFSGIVLNHRQLFSSWEVGRWWLPENYHYENWNNGIVKGTLRLNDGKVIMYGNAGVWTTDSCFSQFSELNEGIDKGIDNRKISHVVVDSNGSLWCAALYGVYKLEGNQWKKQPLGDEQDRIADLTNKGDTIVVLTRSYLYTTVKPYDKFTRHELEAPEDYSPNVSLFKTVWLLHSGELFGTAGRLVVDFVAIVLVVLCLTGLVFTFVPKIMRRRRKLHRPTKRWGNTLKFSVKWHNRLGLWLIGLTLLLSVTGMCLRPPLMIPLVMTQVPPIPGSTLKSDNSWNDKFRAIRYDEHKKEWLLSTSEGFYSLTSFDKKPSRMAKAPTISPMGITVFQPKDSTHWLVGSFSGLFLWNPTTGETRDYITGKPLKKTSGRPFSTASTVTGYSSDICGAHDVIFDYGKGAKALNGHEIPQMPSALAKQPMSLWNFCLELHVGRCYDPIIGPFSVLFVFLSGLVLTLLLVSGLIIYKRRK